MTARVSSTIRGLDRFKAGLEALPAVAQADVGAALGDIAEGAAAELRARLPAMPPAAVRVERDSDGIGASVTLDLPYARALEFGTAKTPPRALLRPAMMAAGSAAATVLGAALRRASTILKGGMP